MERTVAEVPADHVVVTDVSAVGVERGDARADDDDDVLGDSRDVLVDEDDA